MTSAPNRCRSRREFCCAASLMVMVFGSMDAEVYAQRFDPTGGSHRRPVDQSESRGDLGGKTAAQGDHPIFQLDLAGPREPILVCMPVPLRLSLKNTSSEPASIYPGLSDPDGSSVEVYVQRGDGPFIRWRRKWHTLFVCVDGQQRAVNPGQSVASSVELYWQPEVRVFDVPGYYTILVVWKSSTGRSSAKCVVKVVAPAGRDADCLAMIRKSGLETYLPLEGLGALDADVYGKRHSGWEESLRCLADVVEKHGESPYAGCAMATILFAVPPLSEPATDRSRRLSDGLKQRLDSLIKARMKNERDPRVVYAYARHILWTDHSLASLYIAAARQMPSDSYHVSRHINELWGRIGKQDAGKPAVPAP